ncbi:Crp/Fnr family transcriptional regulator [Hydrogenophaga defluvii]|uniref:Crp/Fnr family transcriptional regulator n=1 Tax=Hydrogenophaga defluvii TaxID=249410 RepID=A0ABW2S9Y7_9BURK
MPKPTSSLALSHELAATVWTQLDTARFPVQRLNKGWWLNLSDHRLQALPFVVQGRLDAVLALGEEGTRVIPVSFGPGEIALLSALFADEPVHGQLLAAETAQVRWLPKAELESLLQQHPPLLLLLVRFLAQRLREVRARERGWLERSVHERVRAGLARVALATAPAHAGQPWYVVVTHEQLAQRCGVSRPKLSLALKQLECDGVVRLGRGRIEVLQHGALTAGT